MLNQDAAFKEVQLRNTHLRQQLEQLEKALASRPKVCHHVYSYKNYTQTWNGLHYSL